MVLVLGDNRSNFHFGLDTSDSPGGASMSSNVKSRHFIEVQLKPNCASISCVYVCLCVCVRESRTISDHIASAFFSKFTFNLMFAESNRKLSTP